MPMYTCTYVRMHLYTHDYVHMAICTCTYIHMPICTRLYTHGYIYVCEARAVAGSEMVCMEVVMEVE
jgi:hypothetical protein